MIEAQFVSTQTPWPTIAWFTLGKGVVLFSNVLEVVRHRFCTILFTATSTPK